MIFVVTLRVFRRSLTNDLPPKAVNAAIVTVRRHQEACLRTHGFLWRSTEAMDSKAMVISSQMKFKSWANFPQLCCHWWWRVASIRHLKQSRRLWLNLTRFLFQSTPRLTKMKCNCFLSTSTFCRHHRLTDSGSPWVCIWKFKSTRLLFQSTPRLTNLKCNCFLLTSTL